VGAKNGQREAAWLAGRAGVGWGGKAQANHSVRSEREVCAQCERGVCGVCTLHARFLPITREGVRVEHAQGRGSGGGRGESEQRGREKTVGDVPLGALCVRSACVDRARGAGDGGVK
jgi:hypothetical protein